MISVGDAINEPRYPSLKAIMGAKKKPLDTVAIGDVGIEAGRSARTARSVECGDFNAPPQKAAGEIIEDEDTNETVEQIVAWLDERKLSRMSSDILVYALHYEGAFNKNSLGAVSEGARLAGELGGEAHAVVRRRRRPDRRALRHRSAPTARRRSTAPRAPEGLAQPVVDVMAKVIADNGHGYALFGGGLLGFEIGAGLAARLNAGVTMEVTRGQGRGRQARRRAPDPRRLVDLRGRATRATSASSSAA